MRLSSFIFTILLSLVLLSNTTSLFAQPVIDGLSLSTLTRSTITVSFDNTGIEDQELDFFLVYTSGSGIYYLKYIIHPEDLVSSNFGWVKVNSIDEIEPIFQGKLGSFEKWTVNTLGLPGVSGAVHFGVDFNPNGKIDFDSLKYDSWTVLFDE